MQKNPRPFGWLLVAAGAVLISSQIIVAVPWQAGIALGLALLFFGGAVLADNPSARRDT